MNKPLWLKAYQFAPIINLPEEYYIHDFTQGPDPLPTHFSYSIGRYNEERKNMYTTELFTKENRNIHMGIDIAAPVGEPVHSFHDGKIVSYKNNLEEGDYGPTLICQYDFGEHRLYALYGHLSLESIANKKAGDLIQAGEVIGFVGSEQVNGGWFPHLHFQLSLEEPKDANMPGVVAQAQHQQALQRFPDPRWVLGNLYS